jgi:hypothetical protein
MAQSPGWTPWAKHDKINELTLSLEAISDNGDPEESRQRRM